MLKIGTRIPCRCRISYSLRAKKAAVFSVPSRGALSKMLRASPLGKTGELLFDESILLGEGGSKAVVTDTRCEELLLGVDDDG